MDNLKDKFSRVTDQFSNTINTFNTASTSAVSPSSLSSSTSYNDLSNEQLNKYNEEYRETKVNVKQNYLEQALGLFKNLFS
jgi:hypothetical protein